MGLPIRPKPGLRGGWKSGLTCASGRGGMEGEGRDEEPGLGCPDCCHTGSKDMAGVRWRERTKNTLEATGWTRSS